MANATPLSTTATDADFALIAAHAIERDPSLLEKEPDIMAVIADSPAALEVIRRVFARKKVAFRFQQARAQIEYRAAA